MNRGRLLFLLSFINFIAVFVCIFFLPQIVVFRFDSEFLVSEVVNKWLNIILPTFQLIACLIILIIDIKTAGIRHHYRYIVEYIAVSIAMLYTWIMIVIQFGDYKLGDKVAFPLSTIILVFLGLFMVAYTYYQMSKKMNSFSIFNFSWVRKKLIVWKKTHFSAGVTGAIAGLLIMACGIVNDIVFRTNWIYLIAFGIYFFIYYIFTILHSIRVYRFYK